MLVPSEGMEIKDEKGCKHACKDQDTGVSVTLEDYVYDNDSVNDDNDDDNDNHDDNGNHKDKDKDKDNDNDNDKGNRDDTKKVRMGD